MKVSYNFKYKVIVAGTPYWIPVYGSQEPCRICKTLECRYPQQLKCQACGELGGHQWKFPNKRRVEKFKLKCLCVRCAKMRGLLW